MAKARPFSQRDPKVVASKGGTRVSHQEFLGTFACNAAYTNEVSYELNPGLAATFPWLSNTARNYEKYIVHHLEYIWLTRRGLADGSVIISPEYDADDPLPTTEAGALNTADAQDSVVWHDLKVRMDRKLMDTEPRGKYIRTGNIAGSKHTYDVGHLTLASVGGDGALSGKLFVKYDITMFAPQTSLTGPPQAISSSSGCFGAPGAPTVLPLGTGTPLDGIVFSAADNVLNAAVNAGAQSFGLPRGNYNINTRAIFKMGNEFASTLYGGMSKNGTLIPNSSWLANSTATGTPGSYERKPIEWTTPITIDSEDDVISYNILAGGTAPDVVSYERDDYNLLSIVTR